MKLPAKLTSTIKLPCEKCGHNRWKTKHKRNPTKLVSTYACRKCGKERDISLKQYIEEQGKGK